MVINVLLFLSIFLCPLCVSQYIPTTYSAWFRNRDSNLLRHLRNFQIGDKNYTISPFKAKYFQALHFCHYYGMSLVSIDSKDENNKIHEYLSNYGFTNDFFWTSGNKLADDRNWLWASSGEPVRFANWQYLEPNNKYGLEKCIELRQSSNSLVWNDVSCFDSDVFKYFICDKKIDKDCDGEEEEEESRVPVVKFMSMVHQEATTEFTVSRETRPPRVFEQRTNNNEDDCTQYTVDNTDGQQIHININFE